MIFIDIAVAFIHATGIMALTAIVFGAIIRSKLMPIHRSVLIGLLFSATSIFAMLTPVEFANGIIIDGRAIMVGLGAAFGGLPAAIVLAICSSATRLYIGGEGAFAGVVGILMAISLGYLWIRLCPCNGRPNIKHLVIGGVVISLQFTSAYLLPLETANQIVVNVYPIMLPTFIISAVILGTLIERERKVIEATRNLERVANTDPLTGLMNRRGLELAIEKSFPDSQKMTSVVVFDLDHFKAINDLYGHEGGDKALVTFGAILKLNIRTADFAARIGGEEFALFLPETNAEQASTITQRILQSVRTTPIHTNGVDFPVTVSAGVAQFWAQETEYWQAIREADHALYQAKSNGRDQMMQSVTHKAA